jgi:UDP-N-acetylmuramoylalanine--D-glutamate ligase
LELCGKNILVVGLAKTGVACCRFLAQRGARVVATDMRDEVALAGVLTELAGLGIHFVLGRHDEADFLGADLITVSPGVPMDHPLLVKALAAGREIISEIELAARFINAPLVAITGTNGKTTTTTLCGEIFRANGFATYVGGNIGDPLIELVDSGEAVERVVVEISSFQMEWINSFRPSVAALLNISEDHLDRYASYQAYIDAKLRIFENQSTGDFAVLNADDPLVWQYAPGMKGFSPSAGSGNWIPESSVAVMRLSSGRMAGRNASRPPASASRGCITWRTSWRRWPAPCSSAAGQKRAWSVSGISGHCTTGWSLSGK